MSLWMLAARLMEKAPEAAEQVEKTKELTMIGPFSLRSLITIGLGVLLLVVAFIVSRITRKKRQEAKDEPTRRYLKNKFGNW